MNLVWQYLQSLDSAGSGIGMTAGHAWSRSHFFLLVLEVLVIAFDWGGGGLGARLMTMCNTFPGCGGVTYRITVAFPGFPFLLNETY